MSQTSVLESPVRVAQVPQVISLALTTPHPDNPRIIIRQDVVDAIASYLSGIRL